MLNIIYIYIYIYIYMCIYIICREREIEREREIYVCLFICLFRSASDQMCLPRVEPLLSGCSLCTQAFVRCA